MYVCWSILYALLLARAHAAASTHPRSFLQNPSFESHNGTLPSAWIRGVGATHGDGNEASSVSVARAGELLNPDAPLFANQSGSRISKRRVQVVFRHWQERAGFDRLYPLHALRHTAVTNVYRSSRDLFLAQRFARHVSPMTTVCYTHPSDEELREGVRELVC
jgi:integrase